ncbi:MAG: hypothetical protein RR806_08545 [Oscillospiraceae bacterium]
MKKAEITISIMALTNNRFDIVAMVEPIASISKASIRRNLSYKQMEDITWQLFKLYSLVSDVTIQRKRQLLPQITTTLKTTS